MPDKNTARNTKPRTGGRPFGSVTRFPGSCVFAAEHGVTPSHLYRVLIGERQSKRLIASYQAWLTKHNLPWPKDAVTPAA